MDRLLLDHFRCPAVYVNFDLIGEVVPATGFFRFGRDVVCYGNVCSGSTQEHPSGALPDLLTDVRVKNGQCHLPFNPDEIVQNLRYERYTTPRVAVRRSVAQSVGRKTYYAVRPFLPTSVRKHLQRMALRGWDQTPFPGWPIDQTVDRFFDQMMALVIRANNGERVPFIWFWPDGHSACAVMTHDVETSSGRDFCNSLMDLDDRFGIKSSFQLIPEDRYEVPESLLNNFRKRGFEINVHDFNHDGELFKDREQFLHRVARINEYGKKFRAEGYRSGVLYRNLDWYDSFDYSYDMSVPNVGHLDPQPGGCCTTTPFFIGKILEIPVVATQDYTLFNILRQYSTDLWEQQLEMALEHNGLISFIVHPDYLLEQRAREVYTALLSLLSYTRKESKLWTALPREVNDWWRKRNEMRLVKEGSSWQIDGPDKHRARIAYASLEAGRVVYTMDETTEFPETSIPSATLSSRAS